MESKRTGLHNVFHPLNIIFVTNKLVLGVEIPSKFFRQNKVAIKGNSSF